MGNAAHQHLLVNHFPIVAAFLAVPLLVLTLLLRRERGLLLASVFLLVVTAVSGWASYSTGEKAWNFISENEGKSWADDAEDQNIGAHEDRAEKAMYVAAGTALVGLVVLVLAHLRPAENPLPRLWIVLLLVAAAATGAAMAWVGNAGGVIVHREIRGDSLDTTVKK